MYVGGEMLDVSADPFRTTLVAPSKLTITSPAQPSPTSGRMTIDPAFGFAWEPTTSEKVEVTFILEGGFAIVQCAYPSVDGNATLPASVLSEFPTSPAYVSFATLAKETALLDTKDGAVDVSARFQGNWPDGSAAGLTNAEIAR